MYLPLELEEFDYDKEILYTKTNFLLRNILNSVQIAHNENFNLVDGKITLELDFKDGKVHCLGYFDDGMDWIEDGRDSFNAAISEYRNNKTKANLAKINEIRTTKQEKPESNKETMALMKQALEEVGKLEVMWDNAISKITNQQGENK